MGYACMDSTARLMYTRADPVFFDTPDRLPDQADRFSHADAPAPPAWHRAERGLWVTLRPPDVRLPAQGWKAHVSATIPSAERAISTTWKYCVDNGLAFKFLRSKAAMLATNSKEANRGSSGKLVTIYPEDEGSLGTILHELSRLLTDVPGPYILSDLRYGSGPLYVRYGAFVEQYCPDENGEPTLALSRPDGALVPDRRGPVFTVPDWVALPNFLTSSLDARNAISSFPYDIQSALWFSNGGGIYLASDKATGERVVLREARPHAGLDADSNDAMVRLRREELALTRLAGLDCVPRLLGHHVAWEHHYLAMEYIIGRTLQSVASERFPFTRPDPSADEVESYYAWAREVMAGVDQALDAIHARGVRYGDLHPGNIMLRTDGRVVLVDFEMATDLSDPAPVALRAPGFAPPAGLTGAVIDDFAAGRVRQFLHLPLVQLLGRCPAKQTTFTTAVHELYVTSGGPEPVPADVHGTYAMPSGERDDAAALFATEAPNWPAIRDSLVAGILTSATPDREDRLFPGDPTQFETGGISLRTGAAGVLMALHRVGAPGPAEHVDWLVRAARRQRQVPRAGLYDGRHGVAVVLNTLGYPAEASEVLALARADGHRLPAIGLLNGRAGVALALLHFADRDGGGELLDTVIELGDDLSAFIATGDTTRGLRPPRAAGLMQGWSAAALVLLHLYERTGVARYLDVAETALDRDLDGCEELPDGTLHVRDRQRYLPFLATGTAGIALVLRQFLRHRDNGRFVAATQRVLRGCRGRFVSQAGLFEGRAGLMATLSEFDADEDRPVLRRHVRHLGWHAVMHAGHLAFPGTGLLRLSTDLATGSAGVLLALHTVFEPGTPVLPMLESRAPRQLIQRSEGR